MDTKLKTVYVNVNDLKPATYNPRKWPQKAIRDLTKSIKEYGFVDAMLANSAKGRENTLIAGHFRLHVAKKLGINEVPVCYVNIPDIEKEKSLNLTLNKVEGEWDFDLLKSFDVDMLLDVGFSSKDLAPIWNELLGVENDEIDLDKELGNIKESNIKSGDLFELGSHRLICGDSTNSQIIKTLAQKDVINVLYCDPPYNISLNYDKGFGKDSKYGGKVNDSKSVAEYENFISKSLQNGLSVCNKDAHIFYYCDENYIWLIQKAFIDNKIKLKRVCIWIKNSQNPTPQTAFNKCYEPCVYGTLGSPHLSPVNNLNEVLNKEIGTGNDTIDDINNLWVTKRLNTSSYEHPTEKPPILHERPLRRCSRMGDVVLDLFGGSGSTLIACEQLGRKALIVEMDPIFCELIIRRYEKLTGKKARKVNR